MSLFFKLVFLGWFIVGLCVPLSAVSEENAESESQAAVVDTPGLNDVSIEAGLAAVELKNYSAAFSVFETLAEAGNAEAQHNLAMLYRTGKGIQKDLASSYKWFRRAADQGASEAQYYLGYLFDMGEGVEKNSRYAFVWYRKAAEQGHGLGQINLGFLYANGAGVGQDIEQAYLWFHVAAAQGYKVAFENKIIIEEALKEQENGVARLGELKQRARVFFQQYVMPFARPPMSHQSRKISSH